MYSKLFKRPLDLIVAAVALVILFPILLVLALIGAIMMKGNPFFTQERPGKNGKIFKLIKYRTMTNKCDINGKLLEDEKRLIPYGKFLRSTSLDELPELINIFMGNMSLVGPRPLVPEYLPYYTKEEAHRHDVRPGLTGLAQINGRSFISWEEIFAYDVQYVNNITFIGDAKIVLETIQKVFARRDIADVSEAWKDENGRYHCLVNGKDTILHDPLNVERDRTDVEGNR